ncbi:GTP-binding protein [Ralstonia pseudosolanacearum]|uniref:GTP-binding protein n=1 Tax=Ralstonia pseudosolanacearum TaxID=1310165 RepID=UPI0020036401|nr:ATP/GTP-binding protein [Ralstonia pseudosolanacearum]MCK4130199.1 GTP-binding protein [Ralstonia pseudosolanacearum]
MERSVLFIGPVGSGKTQAINSVSEIDVVDTEVLATDETQAIKSHTTVAMDVGTVHLGDGDKLRIYGAPGQSRFDFMWDILLDQSHAVVLLIDHSSADPASDLAFYVSALEERLADRVLPVIIGVTHSDLMPDDQCCEIYQRWLREHSIRFFSGVPPVLRVDARRSDHLRALLIVVTALLEIEERYPRGMGSTPARPW